LVTEYPVGTIKIL